MGPSDFQMVKIHFRPDLKWRTAATLKTVKLRKLSRGLSGLAKLLKVHDCSPERSLDQNQALTAGRAPSISNAAFLIVTFFSFKINYFTFFNRM